jgi:plastocyanin
MRISNRLMSVAAAIATSATLVMPATTLAAVNAPSAVFAPGDLIKGKSSQGVYYYASNGKRYVFPNEKTYFTWFKDFSGVKTLSDAQLGVIPLGGNVTYRPGVKMVKVTTDPRVYVVDQGGVLRHVGSEQLANTLYGLNWKNVVEDVPDAFFVNYRIGTEIQTVSDFVPKDVTTLTSTIAQDKQFDNTLVTVSIGDNDTVGFLPSTTTVKKGTKVTWTNRDVTPHTVTGNGWASGDIAPGASWSYTFNTTGSFDYRCTIHTVSQGTINVIN